MQTKRKRRKGKIYKNENKRKENHYSFIIKCLKFIGVGSALTLILFGGGVLLMKYGTYNTYRVVKEYDIEHDHEGKFYSFQEGVIKCSTGKVEYLDSNIEPVWTYSINLQNPIVEERGNYGVVASRINGEVLLFNKTGMQGHVDVGYPIEKVDISEQGIVAVITRNQNIPQVMCYDKFGTLLVELSTTLSENGYPMNVALSTKGNVLLVSYLVIDQKGIRSRVVYYDLAKKGKKIAEKILPNEIVAEVGYISNDYSYIMGMRSYSIYNNEVTPKEVESKTFDSRILGVTSNNEYIGILLDKVNGNGSKIVVYNKEGKENTSISSRHIFDDMLIAKDEIILWKGGVCEIYKLDGRKRLESKVNEEIRSVFPTQGLNQYIIVGDKEIKKVQLKR